MCDDTRLMASNCIDIDLYQLNTLFKGKNLFLLIFRCDCMENVLLNKLDLSASKLALFAKCFSASNKLYAVKMSE